MRFAALVVGVIAALGCNNKESSPQATEAKPVQTSAPPRPSLARPQVTGPGLVKVDKLSATVTYGDKTIELDGNSLARIRNGVIDRESLERLLRMLEPAGASGDPVGIALEATLPYLRIAELLFHLKSAGFRNLALLTQSNEAIPLELIDGDQLGTGLRPVVTVRGGAVVLWSLSGEEGTLAKPKARIPIKGTFAPLTAELANIVGRRWHDGMRAAEDRVILVQVGKTEKAETLLQVLAAVRSTGGKELFPKIYLGAGI